MKLLPMILEPYHYLLTHRRYDHPPRIKDGARKAILIRDICNPYTGELLGGYKKGTMGVVVPIDEQCLQDMFLENKEWLLKRQSIYSKDCQRLDRTYDFFRYGTNYKTKKYELSHWHTYISQFDFEYIEETPESAKEEKQAKPIEKKIIQLSLVFD